MCIYIYIYIYIHTEIQNLSAEIGRTVCGAISGTACAWSEVGVYVIMYVYIYIYTYIYMYI